MQTEALPPLLPLCCYSSIENKPLRTKSSLVWAKVLDFIAEKKDLSSAAEVSFLLRAIVWMKRMHRYQYFPSFPSLNVKAPTKFEEMKEASLKLPTFRLIKAAGAAGKDAILTNNALYKAIQLVSHTEFFKMLEAYFDMMKNEFKEHTWLGPVCNQLAEITNQTFYPYAQKLIVEPSMRRIFRGDMHGDVVSFILFIDQLQKDGDLDQDLKLLKPLKLFFLGDFVDRGVWGLEVIYLLLQLKIKNPNSIFIVRGNHEDPEMADRLGFYQEYKAKFGENEDYKKLAAFYNSLPVVLYLGTKSDGPISFIQCCHGGLEWGYNPQELLNTENKCFQRIEVFKRFSEGSSLGKYQVKVGKDLKILSELSQDFKPIAPKNPFPVGFMWSEFNVEPEEKTTYFEERKVFSCSKEVTFAALTAASLGKNTLNAVIRAHQHAPNNPLMKLLLKTRGCSKLWDGNLKDGAVITLLLTPDSDSGLSIGSEVPFTYDTTLEIIGGPKLEDMKCSVINNEVF